MRSVLIALIITFTIPSPSVYCADAGSADKTAVRNVDRLVARVNSEPITDLEVQALRTASPGLTYSAALDVLIDQRVVFGWAKKNGIKVSRDDILRMEKVIMETNGIPEDSFDEVLAARGQDREEFRQGLRDQILVNKALSTALEPVMRIEEAEIKEQYDKLYPPEKTFTIRHILLKPGSGSPDDETAAMDLADRIMNQIRNGASFEEKALEYSDDKVSAAEGGFLGTFREGELLPELEKLARELEPGQLGGPIRTSTGIHIVKMDGKGLAEPPPLSQVRDKIRADIISRREPEAREKWLKELREKAYIEVFTDGE